MPTSWYGVAAFVPPSKIGNENYIYVYSYNAANYYGLSAVSSMFYLGVFSTPGLTVQQASAIDTKMDDGLPQQGRVTARYLNGAYIPAPIWAAGGGVVGASGTAATIGSSTTCYDNGNVAGTTQQYSLAQNTSNLNCALSFQFQ